MNLILNERSELRSGWKFAIYVTVFVVIYATAAMSLMLLYPRPTGPVSQLTVLTINAAALFFPSIGALLFMCRKIDHVPVTVFGVAFHDRWARDLALGLAISAGMLLLLAGGSAMSGGFNLQWTASRSSHTSLMMTVLLLLFAAANEELVFRGYPLQILMRGIGPWPAVILLSALFGILHLSNPDATVFSTINTALAGILLSIAYLKTRSLWLPYGIHIGWNLGLGFVLGYPLSGIDIDSLWTTAVRGPVWLTGGSYGPEGGLICSLIFILAALAARMTRAAAVSPQLRHALTMNAAKIYFPENQT